jgi:isopropanol dehydrogenase (NADP+)
MAKIPDAVPDEVAIYCADMLSTGFIGPEHGNIPIGGTVAVLAQGPAGLMATLEPNCAAPASSLVSSRYRAGRKLAHSYGADEIIDFSKEDVLDRVMELTGAEGVGTAIEALGANVTFETAVKTTKPGSTISVVGYFGKGEYVNIPRVEWGVGMGDKTIATGLCPGGRLGMRRLLRVLEMKRVDPTLMTTHTFGLDEMERAFEVADKKLGGHHQVAHQILVSCE